MVTHLVSVCDFDTESRKWRLIGYILRDADVIAAALKNGGVVVAVLYTDADDAVCEGPAVCGGMCSVVHLCGLTTQQQRPLWVT